jgi:adenylate kinase
MFNVIIFGPPGSGKGTQSLRISKKYNLKHISTGDILRSEVKRETPLGKKVKKIMTTGELVPDYLLIEIFLSVIDQNPDVKGFIFDGFPRTIYQATELDNMLQKLSESVNVVVSLEVDDQEVVDRLLKRAQIEGRKDDNRETIEVRLGVYKKQTTPLLDYYRKQGKIENVAGIGSIDSIFAEIDGVLCKKCTHLTC